MATKKQKGLGRGLEALLGSDATALDTLGQGPSPIPGIVTLAPDVLATGKYQPRTQMDDEAIATLAESIRHQGVMQPLIVRKIEHADGKTHEVIAGERRLRAAIKAGLEEVPVIVREVDDEQAAIMALIENIQRQDLNPMEEARGLKRLLEEFAMTHEQIASTIGRSRSATSNMLRLLNLAQPVQDLVSQGKLDMGHARALLSLDAADQIQAANLIIAKGMSARDAERLVAKGLHQDKSKKSLKPIVDPDLARMQTKLADRLATTITLKANTKGKGQVTMHFHDWEQFHGLLERLGLSELVSEE